MPVIIMSKSFYFIVLKALLVFSVSVAQANSTFDDFKKYKIPIISDWFIDKYNVEEAAYFHLFESSIDDINDISLPFYEILNVRKSYEDISSDLNEEKLLEEKENQLSNFISDILEVKNEHFDDLKETLPPEGLEEVHSNLLSVLSIVEEETFEHTQDDYWTKIKIKTYLGNRDFTIKNEYRIAAAIKDFHISLKEYKETLESREVDENPDRLYMLYYTPPSAPFSLSVDSKGAFSVKFKYSTPVGDFAIGRSAAEGVKELIIINDGMKRRYRMAGKSFDLYIPENNGFKIDYSGEENTLKIIITDNMI
jgi:hypothetical protein